MKQTRRRSPATSLRAAANPVAEAPSAFSQGSLNHGLAVRMTHRAFLRSLTAAIASHGLTGVEFLVLRTLWEHDGITPSDLAQRISLDGPHVTSTLNAMEKKQLVTRERNARDRRKVNVRLTRKSRRYRARLIPRLMLVSEAAARGIPVADIVVLHRVLRRMRENLAAFSASVENARPDETRKKAPGGKSPIAPTGRVRR